MDFSFLPPNLIRNISPKAKLTLANFFERQMDGEGTISYDPDSDHYIMAAKGRIAIFNVTHNDGWVIVDPIGVRGVSREVDFCNVSGPTSSRKSDGSTDFSPFEGILMKGEGSLAQASMRRLIVDDYDGTAIELQSNTDIGVVEASVGTNGLMGALKLAVKEGGVIYYSEPTSKLEPLADGYDLSLSQVTKGISFSVGFGLEGGISRDNMKLVLEKPRITPGFGIDFEYSNSKDLSGYSDALSDYEKGRLYLEACNKQLVDIQTERLLVAGSRAFPPMPGQTSDDILSLRAEQNRDIDEKAQLLTEFRNKLEEDLMAYRHRQQDYHWGNLDMYASDENEEESERQPTEIDPLPAVNEEKGVELNTGFDDFQTADQAAFTASETLEITNEQLGTLESAADEIEVAVNLLLDKLMMLRNTVQNI